MVGRIRYMILSFGVISITLIFLFFTFNQIVAFYQFFAKNFPEQSNLILFSIVAFFGLALLGIFSLLFFSPKTFIPPKAGDEIETAKYVKRLSKHLSRHYLVQVEFPSVSSRQDVEQAILILNKEADIIIQDSASSCFIGTAIALNGKMDASFVSLTLVKMVWRLIHIYYPSPSFFQFFHVYRRIFIIAIIITEIEEKDIARQVHPIVKSMFASGIAGTIAGLNLVATLLTNSILDGTVNAFFTLRVGIVCKLLCNSLLLERPQVVLSRANKEAAEKLPGIVKDASSVVSNAIKQAASQTSRGIFTEPHSPDASATATTKDIISAVAKSVGNIILERGSEKKKDKSRKNEDDDL